MGAKRHEPLTEPEQVKLRAMIARDGIDAAAARVGTTAATLARAAAGAGVFGVTRAAVRAALGKR